VTAIGAMLLDGGLPAVVVMEPHMQRQWTAKLAEFTDLTVHAVKTRTPYRLPAADVYLFRYSNIAGWVDVLAEMRVGLACWDEIQALRTGVGTQHDPKAKGIASAVLARQATLRLGLSATPIYNYGGEIFNILSFLDAKVLGPAELFTREWGAVGGRLSDPEALRAYMAEDGIFIRRTRADVGRELPPVNKILEEVDPDGSALADIEATARALAMTAATGSFTERGQATRELDLRLRHATGVAKAQSVAAYVRILVESGEPVVLVGWHRDVYAIWQDALEDLAPVYYTGSESAAAKAESARAFMAGETDLLIASLRSGAGLDGLQDRCKTIVFGEFDWSPPVHHQWIGRLARDRTDGGPENQVLAVFIWTDDGSDPPMMEVLGLKASEQAAVIDGGAIQEGLSDREGLRALVNRYLDRETVDRERRSRGGEDA
jgi:superfamily II DNA or RNA helicase